MIDNYADVSAQELVSLLLSSRLVCKVGILAIGNDVYEDEPSIAAGLGVESLDLSKLVMDSLPEDTKFIRVTVDSIIDLLDSIASRASGHKCVLIYNLDIMLAKLLSEERKLFWDRIKTILTHRPRSILLSIPGAVFEKLDNRSEWEESRRAAWVR